MLSDIADMNDYLRTYGRALADGITQRAELFSVNYLFPLATIRIPGLGGRE
jgi:hypothetical protein